MRSRPLVDSNAGPHAQFLRGLRCGLRNIWSLESRPGLRVDRGRREADMIVVVVTLVSASVLAGTEAMGATGVKQLTDVLHFVL